MTAQQHFEKACKALKLDPKQLPIVSGAAARFADGVIKNYKLAVIAEHWNKGWVADWSNSDQLKYYPWMRNAPGSGFSLVVVNYHGTFSDVGARLIVFKTNALAEKAGKELAELYN